MKLKKILIPCLLMFIAIPLIQSQNNNLTGDAPKPDSVKIIKEYDNTYQSGDYYLGGQPTLKELKWLKSAGVTLIINLRSNKENRDFAKESFDEEKTIKELGISYKSIPVVYPDSYNTETLNQLIEALYAHKGKVFIHCKSGGRVRLFFMAYLVKAKNYSLNEAYQFGKQIGYTFLLEDMLGSKIKMELEQ